MKIIHLIKTIIAIGIIALSSAAFAQQNTTGINVPPPSPTTTPNNSMGTSPAINSKTYMINHSGAAGASCAAGTPNCACPTGTSTNCKINTTAAPGTAY